MKNIVYFPHDNNSSEDEKIIHLLSVLGWQGYGLYWAIIERLHSSKDGYMELECDRIAFALRTDINFIKQLLFDFNLFKHEGNRFTSDRVQSNLKEIKRRSDAGKKGAKGKWDKVLMRNATAMRPQCDTNGIKEKKRKEKETKEKKMFSAPTLQEIIDYCSERGNNIDPQHFFDKGQSNGWVDKNGNKYKDWKAVIRTWEKYGNDKSRLPTGIETYTDTQKRNLGRLKDAMEGINTI